VKPEPLNDGGRTEPDDRPLSRRGWAMVLALAAAGMDGLAGLAGISGGGRGWVEAFPCLSLNGLVAPGCAFAAACFAVDSLARARGRDAVAWVALAVAVGAAGAAAFLAKWSVDAQAGV
jgi:hypothetical protein